MVWSTKFPLQRKQKKLLFQIMQVLTGMQNCSGFTYEVQSPFPRPAKVIEIFVTLRRSSVVSSILIEVILIITVRKYLRG